MNDRLYTNTENFHLGWFPSVYIMPKTLEGFRVLALEALRVGESRLIDKLELAVLPILKIEPQGEIDGNEKAEAVELFHERTGIVIEWLVFSANTCPACEGRGELTAWGHDRVDYDVECPRCSGSGEADDADERTLYTDIDGVLLKAA
ncbi:MAG TPA: hypothetical protein VI229_00110 [Burkholderiales bacterium]